jgi:hypothetical protein
MLSSNRPALMSSLARLTKEGDELNAVPRRRKRSEWMRNQMRRWRGRSEERRVSRDRRPKDGEMSVYRCTPAALSSVFVLPFE